MIMNPSRSVPSVEKSTNGRESSFAGCGTWPPGRPTTLHVVEADDDRPVLGSTPEHRAVREIDFAAIEVDVLVGAATTAAVRARPVDDLAALAGVDRVGRAKPDGVVVEIVGVEGVASPDPDRDPAVVRPLPRTSTSTTCTSTDRSLGSSIGSVASTSSSGSETVSM